MIKVVAKMLIKEDKVDTFVETCKELVAASKQDEGNIGYTFNVSVENPCLFAMIENWKDQASLDVHHASPMMQTIMQLREKYDLHMRAERYSQEDQAVSAADAAFIRK